MTGTGIFPGLCGARGPSPREGSAAVEFALVAPVFIALLMGVAVYGGWFWLANSAQSLATEAARAAIGGLDTPERVALAGEFTAANTAGLGFDPRTVSTAVEATDTQINVTISVDIRTHPLMALRGFLPAPPVTITRTAVVRTGGF